MATEGDVSGEPGQDQLSIGEAVAVNRKRSFPEEVGAGVYVRVVGAALTWVEAAEAWVHAMEAVLVSSPHGIHLVSHTILPLLLLY